MDVSITNQKSKANMPISLLRNPIQTTYYFSLMVRRYIVDFVVENQVTALALILLSIVYYGIHLINGPHIEIIAFLDEFGLFIGWWVGLGIASSVGLGTGLHTFVLYLGPYIANVALIAGECNTVPRMLPSRWNFHYFEDCTKEAGSTNLSFLTLLNAVQLEGFLWGLGTAIGELPPYFVARAAALANKETEEFEDIDTKENPSTMDKAKSFFFKLLQKYSFIAVMLFASIPNPLFDLAGLACGHFLIPFTTFFTATFIGKAIFKVHFQMIFVLFVFSEHHVEHILSFLESNLPFLKNTLTSALEKQKLVLTKPDLSESAKPLIGKIWDLLILTMVVFFVYSIINSLANQYKDEIDSDHKISDSEAKDDSKEKKKKRAKRD